MNDIKFGKLITHESYQEGVVISTKREREVSLMTSKDMLLKDMIDSLSVINNGETHKLELCIEVNKQGTIRLIKKWIV